MNHIRQATEFMKAKKKTLKGKERRKAELEGMKEAEGDWSRKQEYHALCDEVASLKKAIDMVQGAVAEAETSITALEFLGWWVSSLLYLPPYRTSTVLLPFSSVFSEEDHSGHFEAAAEEAGSSTLLRQRSDSQPQSPLQREVSFSALKELLEDDSTDSASGGGNAAGQRIQHVLEKADDLLQQRRHSGTAVSAFTEEAGAPPVPPPEPPGNAHEYVQWLEALMTRLQPFNEGKGMADALCVDDKGRLTGMEVFASVNIGDRLQCEFPLCDGQDLAASLTVSICRSTVHGPFFRKEPGQGPAAGLWYGVVGFKPHSLRVAVAALPGGDAEFDPQDHALEACLSLPVSSLYGCIVMRKTHGSFLRFRIPVPTRVWALSHLQALAVYDR